LNLRGFLRIGSACRRDAGTGGRDAHPTRGGGTRGEALHLAKLAKDDGGADLVELGFERGEVQVAALLKDGVAFPREAAEAQPVLGQGAGEEDLEVAEFAGHHHVLPADEGDDVALFQKRLRGAGAGNHGEHGEEKEEEFLSGSVCSVFSVVQMLGVHGGMSRRLGAAFGTNKDAAKKT
jgi:hypothetical protein